MVRGRTVVWAVLVSLAVGGWAHAEKLVVFKNGRTLRVESVREDGDWLFLTMGKKSELGVLSRLISSVEEIEGKGPVQLANVQSPGSSGGGDVSASPRAAGRRANPGPPQTVGSIPGNAGDPEAQEEAAAKARSDALSRAASRASTGRIGRVPPAGDAQQQQSVDSGADLTGSSATGGWRSLLDQNGRGRDNGREPDQPRQAGDDPKR